MTRLRSHNECRTLHDHQELDAVWYPADRPAGSQPNYRSAEDGKVSQQQVAPCKECGLTPVVLEFDGESVVSHACMDRPGTVRVYLTDEMGTGVEKWDAANTSHTENDQS